ncbi:MAG TPA: hypothetical protein VGN00_11525 [Puia sp.]|jgi:hypothetical protein
MRLYSLLFIGLLVGATTACAQKPADASSMKMDTTHARPAIAGKAASKSGAAHGLLAVSLPKATKDSLMKNIRAVFQRINSDSVLHAVSLDEDTLEEIIGGSPDNGGDVTGYFKNDTLCKIIMSFGPSYGLKEWEYYYDRGQVVFVYEKDQHFPVTKEGGLDHERLVVGFEGRFYFNKGRLIEKIIKRYDQFMAENIDDNYVRDLLDDTGAYTAALRQQVKKKK